MLEKEVHRMDVLFPSNFKMLFQKDSLLKATRHEGGVNRRLFLAYATALYGIPMLGQAANINRRMKFASNPFSLGCGLRGRQQHKRGSLDPARPQTARPGRRHAKLGCPGPMATGHG